MQRIIAIVGPTASGKSALAVELARQFNGEVISADSRQVYKGLDIGTGKVTKREMRGIPHHLLDVASPRRIFTAQDFVERARCAIEGIAHRNRLPIVCGGTGFYIDALLGKITIPNVPPNPALRQRLSKKTVAQLFTLLQMHDPVRAASIDPHNPVRLIRALEIAKALGEVPQPQPTEDGPLYEMFWIGIRPRDEVLALKIHERLLARLKRGMIAEATHLHSKGLSWKRMEALGLEYRTLSHFLNGKITRQEMITLLERDIRAYAKRQLTYWRRNKDITWYAPADTARIKHAMDAWLARRT